MYPRDNGLLHPIFHNEGGGPYAKSKNKRSNNYFEAEGVSLGDSRESATISWTKVNTRTLEKGLWGRSTSVPGRRQERKVAWGPRP